jgi:tetratricopeptide (TPR) repeat protein
MATVQDHRAWKQIESAIQHENWNEARRLIRLWLRRAPSHHWLLTRLGLTYYEQRQYRKALLLHRKAMRIAPRCPLVIWDYAGALDMLGHKKEALELWRRLVSRGAQRLAFGPCGEGTQWARSLIADCYYRIARVLEEQHQRKRAVSAYEEHLSRRTRGARSIYPRGDVIRRYKALISRA